jgi:hypothetical protein
MQRKYIAEMYIKRLQDTATNIKRGQWKQAYVHTSFPKRIMSLTTRDGLKKLAFTQTRNFIIEINRTTISNRGSIHFTTSRSFGVAL